jgi:carboxypeptidase Q
MVKSLLGILLVLSSAARLPAQNQIPDWDSLATTQRYASVARSIIHAATADSSGYETLTYLCDTFGPRLSGSRNLENAIDWTLTAMRKDGLDNVHSQPARVPHWVRGNESLALLEPRECGLPMLGLGGSIGTSRRGLEADVCVVHSFDELKRVDRAARGKIVLFNVPYTNYGETVRYRSRGAIEAAQAGAVGSLIRSVTPMSHKIPHTGSMSYVDTVPKIPHAAITAEDAEMLQRMYDRGQHPRVRLRMEARTLPDALSRNVIAEIRGSEHPEEIVVLGGHFDSWDVGHGAHDDAGCCVAAWQALRVLKSLHLQPRRTIRLVFWTNEENGMRGGLAYDSLMKESIRHHVLAIEADAGLFAPTGFGLSGSDTLSKLLGPIVALLEPIGARKLTHGGGGVDISPLMKDGVPGMGLNVDGGRYFWYHHSDADTVDTIDPRNFNLCAAALAVVAYVVADLPVPIPR